MELVPLLLCLQKALVCAEKRKNRSEHSRPGLIQDIHAGMVSRLKAQPAENRNRVKMVLAVTVLLWGSVLDVEIEIFHRGDDG